MAEEDELMRGQAVYDKVESLLKGMASHARTPQRQLPPPHARPGRSNNQEEEEPRLLDEEQLGARGQLLAPGLRQAFHVTGNYEPGEVPPSADVLARQVELETALDLSGTGEQSDLHVRMARCLVVRVEDNDPYGNVETLREYHKLCAKDAAVGHKLLGSGGGSMRQTFSADREAKKEALARLQEERDSWLLLAELHSSLEEPYVMEPYTVAVPQSAVNLAYAGDKRLQLWNVVTRWLHATAAAAAGPDEADDARGSGAYKPYTVEAMRKGARGALVDAVDPDSLVACGKLHKDDQDDELSLMQAIWRLVRRGAFHTEVDLEHEEAMKRRVERVCEEYGEPWRAASYCGGRPFRPNQDQQFEGNFKRALWKEMCRGAAKEALKRAERLGGVAGSAGAEAAHVESAVYAALAGDHGMLLDSPLCRGWRDRVWASFRCMVQARLDLVCLENRIHLLQELEHKSGDELRLDQFESRLEAHARSLGTMDERQVFAAARDQVPPGEVHFFEVQRALVEGRFRKLLRGREPEDGVDLCTFACGENWEQQPMALIAQVCGDDFARQHFVPDDGVVDVGFPPELTLSSAPCWTADSRAFAMQFLRFLAHAAIYMNYITTVRTVVLEDSKTEPAATEAVVLAYVHFLLSDKTCILDRYAFVPVFYRSLCTPGLALAVQAALFEAASVASSDSRDTLLEHWNLITEPHYLLPQAARQALRNVRRQWLSRQAPCAFVGAALEEINFIESTARQQQQFERREADAPRPEEGADSHTDIRARLMETWRWLDVDPATRSEALLQANQTLRELVEESFETPGSSLEVARYFLRHVVNTGVAARAASEGADEGPAQLDMSELPASVIERERTCWGLFLDADEAIEGWRKGVAWLVEQGFSRKDMHAAVPSNLPEEIFMSANRTAEHIGAVLGMEGGWLVDKPGEPRVVTECAFQDDAATIQEAAEREQAVGTSVGKPGKLRSAGVTYLCHAFLDVLQEGAAWLEQLAGASAEVVELYSKALKIVDLVARESLGLLPCFDKPGMANLLEKVRMVRMELVRLRLGQ